MRGSAARNGKSGGGMVVRPASLPGLVVVEAETDRRFSRHTHDEFGIGLITEGAQASWSGRGPVEAGAGQVITVNPGEVHDGRPIGDSGRRWRMLYLDPALVAKAAGDILERSEATFEFAAPVIADRRIAERLAALLGIATSEGAGLEAEARLLQLLGPLLARRPRERGFGRVARARQRLDDDPAAAVTLADLADEAGLSRFQLLRTFAHETGLTPHAYLLQKRLGLARQLILAGLPLADVAATAGFSDQSHMTRMFTRAFGFTPGDLAFASPAISFKTGRGPL